MPSCSAPSAPALQPVPVSELLAQQPALVQALRQAIRTHQDSEGWASTSQVGSYVFQALGVKARDYGYASVTKLLAVLPMFELQAAGSVVQAREAA